MSKDFETTISKVCSKILFLKHHLLAFITKLSENKKSCAKKLIKELVIDSIHYSIRK